MYGRGWTLASAVAPAYNLAYPDIVEQPNGDVVALMVRESPVGSACNSTDFVAIGGCGVSAHIIPLPLISGLRAQLANNTPSSLVSRALLLDHRGGGGGSGESFPSPLWPELNIGPGGLTVEAWIDVPQISEGFPTSLDEAPHTMPAVVLDCVGPSGSGSGGGGQRGVALRPAASGDGSVELELRWGPGSSSVVTVRSEPGLLVPGQRVHVAAVVDGGPQMVYFVANGRFCDGGQAEVFGYRFYPFVGNVSSGVAPSSVCTVGGAQVVRVRAYGDRLTVSELIGNYRVGPGFDN
jgi:hypothetical protein